jgi:hypothetical protein
MGDNLRSQLRRCGKLAQPVPLGFCHGGIEPLLEFEPSLFSFFDNGHWLRKLIETPLLLILLRYEEVVHNILLKSCSTDY